MTTRIFDAHAMMVYLEKEPGHEKVSELLAESAKTGKNLYMTSVNWGEIYYIIRREKGIETAEEVLKLLESFPLEIVAIDKPLAKQAATYKANKKMSYADCFAAALAKIKQGELITGDKEFEEVEKEIRIFWVPK